MVSLDPVNEQLEQRCADRRLITIEEVQSLCNQAFEDDCEVLLILRISKKLVNVAVKLECPLAELQD